MKTGLELISAQRKKIELEVEQLKKEGHSIKNDELVLMAITYAQPKRFFIFGNTDWHFKLTRFIWWPWHRSWFKKVNRIAELAKAAALIAMEIDRINNNKSDV